MDFSEEELKQIFKIFKDESEEHLSNIDKCLLELEKRPDDNAIISELFREAHSVKGSARMLEIISIQNLAHKMEDLLGLAKDKTIVINSEIIDILCQGVDIITEILKKLDYNNLNYVDENANALAQSIDDLRESLLTGDEKKKGEIKKATDEVVIKHKENVQTPSTQEHSTKKLNDGDTELSIISHYITHLDNKYQQKNAIIEILTVIQDGLTKKIKPEEKEILELAGSNLKYIQDNEIIPQPEIVQAIEHALKAVFSDNQGEDLSLIIQRQNILKQMLELSNENEKLLNLPEVKPAYPQADSQQPKKAKQQSPTGSYEAGIFKTLRVDTQKLDKLENQVEELIVLKIKNKQHLKTLNLIIEEIQEIQKNLSKTFTDTKYFDKKMSSASTLNLDKLASIRNLQSHIEKINEKTHDLHAQIDKFQKSLLNDDTRLNFLTDEIENMVKSIRILPLATIFHMFPRMVRDIARTESKQVDIIISGSETNADKSIIEEIKSPLIHIIRNAIDHGIETPEERIQAGKNPTGKIFLNSYHSGTAITIEVTDDGRGLNTESIKRKVIKQNLMTEEELSQLSELQIMNLIFWPGFSTGENVTEISGRGVGLDVVHTKISQLDGKVAIQSQPGAGFKITIKIPITLATIKALLIRIKKQIFAISSSFVKTVITLKDNEIITKEGKPHIIYNNSSIRLVKLAELLNMHSESAQEGNNKHNIVVVQIEDTILALEIDEFVRTEEILQKKLNPPLTRVKNISGVSSLSSGESCLILNLNDIIKSALSLKELKRNRTILTLPEKKKRTYNIMVVDDSFTILTLEKNILKSAGFNVVQATNGAEAYQKLMYEKVDLVISDIEMPEMNGIEFLRKVRVNNKTLPIIMLTSLNDDKTVETCRSLGATDFIAKKDCTETMILGKIRNYLKQN